MGERLPPREILVVKPSSLGDIVHTLPAVARIKRTYPTARLRWLINPEWAPLLADNPDVDDVVLFPRQEFKGIRGGFRFATWARVLRRNVRADLILDVQGLLRSALISRLCRASGGKIIGLSDAREGSRFFYDRVTDVSGKPHAVDRYLAMVDSLDASSGTEMEWPLPLGSAPSGFSACEPFVLLHPFSRGAGKSLSLSDIADFCAALAPQKIVVAGRADAELPTFSNGANLLNQTTLLELIWLIRHALAPWPICSERRSRVSHALRCPLETRPGTALRSMRWATCSLEHSSPRSSNRLGQAEVVTGSRNADCGERSVSRVTNVNATHTRANPANRLVESGSS